MGAETLSRFHSRSRHDGFSWKPNGKTIALLAKAKDVLDASPRQMTVRQLYYRLVAALVIPNNIRSYQNLVGMLTKARKVDVLQTSKFVDRARATAYPVGYASLNSYLDIVANAYQRHPNDRQPHYVEVWTEKDALSAIIGDVIRPYGATMVVSKGYTSYTVLVEAAQRFKRQIMKRGAEHCHLLYFGDFDPSGEDIFRVISEEMNALTGAGVTDDPVEAEAWDSLHIQKIGLTREMIDEHGLPPMPAKLTDSRAAGFMAAHGDEAVELDALPPEILEETVQDAVMGFWDQDVRDEVVEEEERENRRLKDAMDTLRTAQEED